MAPAQVPVPLPVRYHIHYGAPIPVYEGTSEADADNPQITKAGAARVQQAVQALIEEGLRTRKGIFQ